MNISELIPGISDDLASLWEETPFDMKCKMNGFSPEQRVFAIARTRYEVLKESHDSEAFAARKLWLEGRELVIKFGEVKILPLKPDLKPVFDMADNAQVRVRLIEAIMCWSPDWELIINNLVGEEYEFGQNQFMVTGYQGDSNKRPSIRAVSRAIGFIDEKSPEYNSYLPKLEIGNGALLNTMQLEMVLGRRVD